MSRYIDLLLFDEESGAGTVAVNPALIRVVKPTGSATTKILFDNEHLVEVRGQFDDVLRHLSGDDIDDEIPN